MPVRAALADLAARPVSSDIDAEFARAADSLETNDRDEGLSVLRELRRRSVVIPAWTARIGLLLAADDLKRGDFREALRELDGSPASAIGLEPYRQMLVARALALAGRAPDSIAAWRSAWETDDVFAMRAAAGRSLADALARGGEAMEAVPVLARVAQMATPADAAAIATDRVRIGLAAGDRAGAAAGARDLAMLGFEPPSVPVYARALLRQAISRLSPAERGVLGRRLAAGTDPARGIRLLRQDAPASWPAADRAANLLALARALLHAGDARGADAAVARIPDDGSTAVFEARLFRADRALEALRRRRSNGFDPSDPLLPAAMRPFLALALPPAPPSVRAAARERLIRLDGEAGLFDDGLDHARAIVAAVPGSIAGFEPLWKLAWERFRSRDFAGARGRFEALASVYRDVPRERRLLYWRARCLDEEGRRGEAAPLFESLAAGHPPDVYALFSRRRVPGFRPRPEDRVQDPSTATAVYRRADELLRLRFFEEAAAEVRVLPPARGKDLRLAEAEFALGRFSPAAAAVKRAFPEIGTAGEARVPDGWRRLFYPIEVGGFLAENAKEYRIDPAVLRGLVRQESVFDPAARSRAGALGLTQLMPGTAKEISRSVLRVRYRRAFLYDPPTNARLGAAYLRTLFDRFSENPLWALAAYNGGPSRMARVLRENPGLPDDEVFESHPAYETRDYVRRVMLFAESYRELYP